MAEFKEAKANGDIIEEVIRDKFREKFPKAFIDDIGKANSDWDVYIPELKYGVEVKGDYRCFDPNNGTGNIVIEVEMNNKLSALSVTKAKYWVIVEGYRFIWLTPLDIYRFIDQYEYQRVSFVGKGDTVAKKAYLLKHEELVKYAWDVGKVEMIPEDHKLYYNNYIELINKNDN